MAQPIDRIHYYTAEEYLVLEAAAADKSEYYDSEIIAMADNSENHDFITGNLNADLNVALRGTDCKAYTSEMKVQVKSKKFFTYPDGMVICGKRKLAEGRTNIITNPTLIVEVSSPSTYKYDRTDKFRLYSALESLRQYVLVDQKRVFIEIFQRDSLDDEWRYHPYNDLKDILKLEAVGFQTPIANIYNNVIFLEGRRSGISHPGTRNND